jgi:dipeptidyl-peptidase-4
MKKSFLSIGLLFFILTAFAQKKELSLKTPYTDSEIYPVRIANLDWMSNENSFTYVDDQELVKEDIKAKKSVILSLENLNKALEEFELDEQKRFPSVNWVSENVFQFILEDRIFHYDISNSKLSYINNYSSESEYIKIASDYKVAFTKENNLFVYDKDKNEIAITNDQAEGVVNGQTVHRSEFGITHGIFWSPNANYLAYYKKDESMVANYPLVDISGKAKVKNTRYPMAGEKSEEVKLYVYNFKTKASIMVKTEGPAEQYLTSVSWSPDEKFIFIGILNRDQNHLKLNKYNAENGEFVKTLFEEKNEKYVEPENPLHFIDNTNFLWFSERDGFNHLYHYNIEGKLISQITKGDWLVTEYLGIDSKNENIFIMATKESPLERHLYSVNLKNQNITKLTKVEGTHNVDLSFDKSYFIDIYSNYNSIAREYALYNSKGKEVRILKKNISPLQKFKVGELTISSLKADDGTNLFYKMYKPHDFDKNKKYPVVVYVYGGPHAQLVQNTWLGAGGFFPYVLANKGYIVFTLDNRGSANRGFEFESAVFRQLGQLEMKDQMNGIEYLKSLNYVDSNRIGVYGWSFGGFMSTSLMTNYNETFKVGVAGGPVIDWKYYEAMYGERYMDTPQDNESGYELTNLLNKVDNLKGDLMLIHGTMDPVVVWQHSLKFLEKCIEKGVMLDYFVYPGHEHNVRGFDRIHLDNKIIKYFEDFL